MKRIFIESYRIVVADWLVAHNSYCIRLIGVESVSAKFFSVHGPEAT